MLRAPGSVLSVLMGSDASHSSCGRGGAMAGGEERSARWLERLGEANEHELGGERTVASQRLQGSLKRPRGRLDGVGIPAVISCGPGRR